MGLLPTLWADTSTGETAGLMSLALVVGGGIQWLLQWLATRRDRAQTQTRADQEQQRKNRKEDEAEYVRQMEKLIERIDNDRATQIQENRRLQEQHTRDKNQLQEQHDQLRREFNAEQVRCKGLEERVKYLQEKLNDNGIKYHHDPDSDDDSPVIPHGPTETDAAP